MMEDRLVLVSCTAPREKFWGVLLALNPTGVTLRGLSLETYEDWLRERTAGGPALLGPVTLFIPSRRIERIEVDESVGTVEGLGERFARLVGRDAREELLPGAAGVAADEPDN
jgi:hypothetical protein